MKAKLITTAGELDMTQLPKNVLNSAKTAQALIKTNYYILDEQLTDLSVILKIKNAKTV